MSRKARKQQKRRVKRRPVYNAAEEAVVSVCKRWHAQGKISDYIHSWTHGQADKAGIDVVVILKSGLAALVQVTFKQSDYQINKKREHHFKLHPAIKIFVVVESTPQGNADADNKIYQTIADDLAGLINKIASASDCIDPALN